MLKVLNSPGKGKGLYLLEGKLDRNEVVVYMKSGKHIPAHVWKKKFKSFNSDRIQIWGRKYPSDIGIHYQDIVWYDTGMKNARLENPHSKSIDPRIRNALINAPLWYRLNHSFDPNLRMKIIEIDGVNTIGWLTKRHIRVRKDRITKKAIPIELTFNYGDVPLEWK